MVLIRRLAKDLFGPVLLLVHLPSSPLALVCFVVVFC